MRVSPSRSALSALAHRARAARSQWGNGRAVRAQTPGPFLSLPGPERDTIAAPGDVVWRRTLSAAPGVDSLRGVLFVTSNPATFSIFRRVSQETRDKGGGKARDGRIQGEMERGRKKVGKQNWKQREAMSETQGSTDKE